MADSPKLQDFNFQLMIVGKVKALNKDHAIGTIASSFSVPLTLIDSIGQVNLNVNEASGLVKAPPGFNPKIVK